MNTLLMTVPADPGELGAVRRRFLAWLAATELARERQDETIIAVHEALASTIEHGPAGATIAIRASIDDDVIAIDISGGRWHPQPIDDARRLSLIQRVIEEVEVRPDPGGTTIRLRQSL